MNQESGRHVSCQLDQSNPICVLMALQEHIKANGLVSVKRVIKKVSTKRKLRIKK